MSQAADVARSHRQVWAAPGSSHDRIIDVARLALPAGVAVLVALLATAPVTMGRDISFVLSKHAVDMAKERMRVSDAEYRGQDTKGQPFSIRAASAVQQTSRDPVVRLKTLSARIVLPDGPSIIRADTGRYNMDTQQVMIDGPVRLDETGGYRIDTRDVAIDLTTRHVASGGPVDGTMRLGRFAADRLTADLVTRVVVLQGRARLHIVQGQARARP